MGHKKPSDWIPYLLLGAIAVGFFTWLGTRSVSEGVGLQIHRESTLQTDPEAKPKELQSVVVHVVGAVKAPQMAKLAPGSRVDDAVKFAGGPTQDADLESINLAALLEDGTQVFVPFKDVTKNKETVAEPYAGGAPNQHYASNPSSSEKHSSSSGPKHPSGPVSLSTGSSEQLQSVPGIGPSTAQSIIDYRKLHGGFASVEEVMNVRGIGPKKFEKMKKWLKL